MIKCAVFKLAHLDLIEVSPEDAKSIDLNIGILQQANRTGGVVTVQYKGRVLYIAGHYELHEGVHEVFLIPSLYLKDHPVIAHRSVKRWIAEIIRTEKQVHRLQTLSLATPERDAWMRSLGFVYEGTHRYYTKEGDDWSSWGIVNGVRS